MPNLPNVRALMRGDYVVKITGDYHPPGLILGAVKKRDGKVLYIVEHPWGIVHIYSEKDLKRIAEGTTTNWPT